ncbi:hypothetical protein MBAV_001754, partial [Candidatus Magnetobacterium bavaricum]
MATSTPNNYTDKSVVEGTTYMYVVSTVKSDGTRSFLSEYVSSDDRDGDGLTDDEEKSLGTDPNKSDTDGDGLSDSEEMAYGTDSLKADTDGDGYSDYDEIRQNSDPLDPTSTPN